MSKEITKREIEKARKKALKLLKNGDFQMRSCWNCNQAHEHLKDAGLIMCFACGHWYMNGVDITQ